MGTPAFADIPMMMSPPAVFAKDEISDKNSP
jgi:hypothetical protein